MVVQTAVPKPPRALFWRWRILYKPWRSVIRGNLDFFLQAVVLFGYLLLCYFFVTEFFVTYLFTYLFTYRNLVLIWSLFTCGLVAFAGGGLALESPPPSPLFPPPPLFSGFRLCPRRYTPSRGISLRSPTPPITTPEEQQRAGAVAAAVAGTVVAMAAETGTPAPTPVPS